VTLAAEEKRVVSQERIAQQLEMLDRRLDNIDSVVTTLVERVMKQPLVIQVVCPACGKAIDVSLTGNTRIGRGQG
jgi:hypothetical protein